LHQISFVFVSNRHAIIDITAMDNSHFLKSFTDLNMMISYDFHSYLSSPDFFPNESSVFIPHLKRVPTPRSLSGRRAFDLGPFACHRVPEVPEGRESHIFCAVGWVKERSKLNLSKMVYEIRFDPPEIVIICENMLQNGTTPNFRAHG
jgi:hypothetical protein